MPRGRSLTSTHCIWFLTAWIMVDNSSKFCTDFHVGPSKEYIIFFLLKMGCSAFFLFYNLMKCILLNKRPHDISLGRLRDQICLFTGPWMAYQSVISFQRRKFQKHDYKIDQSIAFLQSTTCWVDERDSNELHCCLGKYQFIHVVYNQTKWHIPQIFRINN